MIQVLDSNLKNQLNEIKLNLNIIEPPIEFKNKKIITIPAGKTVLGVDYHEIDWGWDNEFPAIGI